MSEELTHHHFVPLTNPEELVKTWEIWLGKPTKWSESMRRFGQLGGLVSDHGGVPRSKSAISLCFGLHKPDGTQIPGTKSRLKDIMNAIEILENEK